jgi:hypothetical protein
VIFEPRKGYICGPVARSTFFALPDGSLERHPDRKAIGGHAWVGTDPKWFSDEPGDAFTEEMEQALWELLVPMLFSLSLMHTRNVTLEPVEPNPTVSARFERRHGRPLVRYKTLVIDPMREVLEREGKASSRGLGHAVHTCRGHFKRYGEDSKLFGRYTGTWWWTEQPRVRGGGDRGWPTSRSAFLVVGTEVEPVTSRFSEQVGNAPAVLRALKPWPRPTAIPGSPVVDSAEA